MIANQSDNLELAIAPCCMLEIQFQQTAQNFRRAFPARRRPRSGVLRSCRDGRSPYLVIEIVAEHSGIPFDEPDHPLLGML